MEWACLGWVVWAGLTRGPSCVGRMLTLSRLRTQAGSAELAEGVCQASYHVFDFMYTQAILNCVDDSIFAGLEGRPTAVEQQGKNRSTANATASATQPQVQRNPVLLIYNHQPNVSSSHRRG